MLLVCHSVLAVCVTVVVLVLVVLNQILIGRIFNMSATNYDYTKMFGDICSDAKAMARCACVACNSCTCACACRYTQAISEIDWEL